MWFIHFQLAGATQSKLPKGRFWKSHSLTFATKNREVMWKLKVFSRLLNCYFQKGSLKVIVWIFLLKTHVKWQLKVFSRSLSCYFQKRSLKVTVWLLPLRTEMKWQLKVFSRSLNYYFQKGSLKVTVSLCF